MSKRFTDTDKWKKAFIKSLDAPYKLLWLYILDDCDHAGVWDVDIDVASLRIGIDVTEEKALELFKGHIVVLSPNKWFVVDFPIFQYGALSGGCKAHKSVIERLEKLNISQTPSKGLGNPLERDSKPLVNPSTNPLSNPLERDKDIYIYNINNKTKKEKKEGKFLIPSKIDTPEFMEVWKNWERHYLNATRKPITDQQRDTQLIRLAHYGHDKAIAMINHAIRKGWLDIYEIKEENTKGINNNAKRINPKHIGNTADSYNSNDSGANLA